MSDRGLFQRYMADEFLQQYRNFHRFLELTRLRRLEYELYVGIYGEEPDE